MVGSNIDSMIDTLSSALKTSVTKADYMPNMWGLYKDLLGSDNVAYFQVTIDHHGAAVSNVSPNFETVTGLAIDKVLGRDMKDVPGATYPSNDEIFKHVSKGLTGIKNWEYNGVKCTGLIWRESYNTFGELLIRTSDANK